MRYLSSAFLGLLIAQLLLGSPPSTGTDLQTLTSSPHVIYHFIRQAAYLSRKADALDQTNGTGAFLRRAFSSTLGLSDSDVASVMAVVKDLDAQFAALDKQAAKIIADAKSHPTAEGLIPPPPPELKTLQQQKVALMRSLRATIIQRLNPAIVAAIDAHLHRLSNHPTTAPGPTQAQ
jgi:hypothetical protein